MKIVKQIKDHNLIDVFYISEIVKFDWELYDVLTTTNVGDTPINAPTKFSIFSPPTFNSSQRVTLLAWVDKIIVHTFNTPNVIISIVDSDWKEVDMEIKYFTNTWFTINSLVSWNYIVNITKINKLPIWLYIWWTNWLYDVNPDSMTVTRTKSLWWSASMAKFLDWYIYVSDRTTPDLHKLDIETLTDQVWSPLAVSNSWYIATDYNVIYALNWTWNLMTKVNKSLWIVATLNPWVYPVWVSFDYDRWLWYVSCYTWNYLREIDLNTFLLTWRSVSWPSTFLWWNCLVWTNCYVTDYKNWWWLIKVDTITMTQTWTIATWNTSWHPRYYEWYIYLTNYWSNTVSKIDPITDTVVWTLVWITWPRALTFYAGKLYVISYTNSILYEADKDTMTLTWRSVAVATSPTWIETI